CAAPGRHDNGAMRSCLGSVCFTCNTSLPRFRRSLLCSEPDVRKLATLYLQQQQYRSLLSILHVHASLGEGHTAT
ncbi:hypothetical protein TYRP_007459, partial [Tyrophagus putrescentiae]